MEGLLLELSLEKEIESTREAMIYTALVDGFSAPTTLELSCKLDVLMNQFDMNRGKMNRCKLHRCS